MRAVTFSPLWFLCVLLLDEMFVQVQALEQRVPGPRSQPVSLEHWGWGWGRGGEGIGFGVLLPKYLVLEKYENEELKQLPNGTIYVFQED